MSASGESPTNERDDARLEAVLLRRVLDLHPARLSAEELVRDLNGAADDFAVHDGIGRAIGELVRAGLLHPVAPDGLLTPTRASVRLGELLVPAV